MKGYLTVREAAEELNTSTRTIFRMIRDGRLKAEKYGLPVGRTRFMWLINPVSVARLQLKKEESGKKRANKEGSDAKKES